MTDRVTGLPEPGHRWEARLYFSSPTGRQPLGIGFHHSGAQARIWAEHCLLRARCRAQELNVDEGTSFMATVERRGERITGYLRPDKTLMEWDSCPRS
jgi:hypothetical protein